jgi:hypothetical protein
MRIELRTSPGCPNAEPTRELLAACLAEAGINEPIIELVGTYPSPTVLINGVDVMGAHDQAEGDVCRLDPPTHFRVLEALGTGQSATWIIPMAIAHAAAVLRIYQAGIETGDATFQTTAPS